MVDCKGSKFDLYTILKECYSGMASVAINDNNMIAMSIKSKYIKKRDQKTLSKELDILIDEVFEDYEDKLYSDTDNVDKNYDHKDLNSKIIIFDTKPDVLLHDHKYIIVKTLLGKNIKLPDITINTREYLKNSDGSISYSKNPRLTNSQIQKYLAFVMGAVNIFKGYVGPEDTTQENVLQKIISTNPRKEISYKFT